ncbi:MAG: hypothetical protein UR39_C0005G0066 [Candidatus Woesebacteria bacterium GW2011_GWA1_33_30]|uniref:Bacterial toxin RNase RnlA/LsoA DBD domain-containing protein n=1 Tax=Candidatus Woesebacteria bacterium GW2011_GWA2_33_28 TaxID=1618561 RepID=A0A0F9ZSK9_9BACT|nr:MAG: hypothetical protein UR38_C0005G0066 [Candidatus Woesebacteria bacterium GW2011_GWA2_33_28]KKP48184.1 MAG: hypothetical protein UR39_C0005G0066 [Candidatus Woesebacteria bacterium GW2011_GWA1_33_30]KKP49426.1 MAG: hypothetical protein UR40_C0006G0066 [Microgenomates group bacterium GW2011_GWC1_33_32]KKP52152.1 MAG: hypothetical protein UR44_C0004G0066 [Candidatus Woesebacteria bacterium GW2011_GWB1_33_38]KKP56042.1 MAG: hypothetical protein UR48_C0042G0006 [Microgenomates group bacteriu
MMDLKLENKIWWSYIQEDLQELLVASEFLANTVKSWGGDLPAGSRVFHDYSFVVFPTAKAYEGFLKKMFFDLGFITEEDYRGKRFRIGKALNPFLEKNLRNRESVYDKLVKYCNGKELADKLWEAWTSGRNLIFHWFPEEKKAVSFKEAEEKINLIINAMDLAFRGCIINK